MSAVRRRNAEKNRSQERMPLRSRPTRTNHVDTALARTILDSPMDFVDDEAFHARDARRRIYDRADDVPLPDTSWYRPLIDDVIGARPQATSTRSSVVLTGAQEQIIFLQYNYAGSGCPSFRNASAIDRRHRSRPVTSSAGTAAPGSCVTRSPRRTLRSYWPWPSG